jgi:hypothetical protein
MFTGSFPDRIIIELMDGEDFANWYERNPFNFQPFGIKCIELKCNGLSVHREGYTPNWKTDAYMIDYNIL